MYVEWWLSECPLWLHSGAQRPPVVDFSNIREMEVIAWKVE